MSIHVQKVRCSERLQVNQQGDWDREGSLSEPGTKVDTIPEMIDKFHFLKNETRRKFTINKIKR